MPKLRLRTSQSSNDVHVHHHLPQRLSELPFKKKRARLSTRTILAMMFSLSTLTLLSSSRIHSRLIRTKDYDGVWGWKPVLRKQQQSNVNNSWRYPPRVVDLDLIPIEIAQKRSIGARIRRWFRGRTVNDEMLHRDGWKGCEEDGEEEKSSDSWFSWSGFFFKNSESRQENEEEDERQCVPMMEWQTTSYPNCNVGKFQSFISFLLFLLSNVDMCFILMLTYTCFFHTLLDSARNRHGPLHISVLHVLFRQSPSTYNLLSNS